MTERLDYQNRVAKTNTPDVFAVDFDELDWAETSWLKAERSGIYGALYLKLSSSEQKALELEKEKREKFSDQIKQKIPSRQLLFNLTGIHREISFLYRYNELTKTEEKEYLTKLAPTLFEYGIDLP